MKRINIDIFNKFWEHGHLLAIALLFVSCVAKTQCLSHPLDIHGPSGEDLVNEARRNDPDTKEVELENGDVVTVYEA